MPTCSGNTSVSSMLQNSSKSPRATPSQISVAPRLLSSVPSVTVQGMPEGDFIPGPSEGTGRPEPLAYLGSAMLSHMATGIGALQRPLSNLYFHAMVQTGGVTSLLPRYLVDITPDGLCVKACKDNTEDDDIFDDDDDITSSAPAKRQARERARSATSFSGPSRLTSGITHHQSQIIYTPERGLDVSQRFGSTAQLTGTPLQTSGFRIPQSSEVIHTLSDVLFWDCALFQTARGEDKRLRFCFQPVTTNTSTNRSGRKNLFVLLDTRYHWLHSLHHLPIFICVVRRSAGIKAIDVHAFLCESLEKGARLTSRLSHQTSQCGKKEEERRTSSTFGYLPFGKETAKSVEGMYQRRSGVRKMSGYLSPGAGGGGGRRQYGSTPALNMMFSVAPTTMVDHTIPYDDNVFRSSLDLTTPVGDRGKTSNHKTVSSSLDSKLKASECLQAGNSLGVQGSKPKPQGKKPSRKLFSLSDLNIIKSGLSRSNKELHKAGRTIASDSMSNLSIGSSATPKSMSTASPISPQPLSPSSRANSNSRVFFLVQEDFCKPKKTENKLESPVGDRTSGSNRSSQSDDIRVNPELTPPYTELYATQEVISSDTILEGPEGEEEIQNWRPVAQVHPQKHSPGGRDVIHVEVHSPPPMPSPSSPPADPLIVNVPPGKRLGQIRFVYYDDAEFSRPDDVTASEKKINDITVNDVTKSAEINDITKPAVISVKNSLDGENSNSPENNRISSVNIFDENVRNSNELSRRNSLTTDNLIIKTNNLSAVNGVETNNLSQSSINDMNASTGNVTIDVTDLNIRNLPYGFSYVVNDITTHNQCIPVNTEVQKVKKLELRRIVVPSEDFQEGRRLPRHSLADFSAFFKPSHVQMGATEIQSGKVWKSSENLRANSNYRRSISPVRDGDDQQSSMSLYSGSSLSVNSVNTENQLIKMMNWQFKCPPASITSDYHTLRPDELATTDSDTIRKENEMKAEKKAAEIATELENLQQCRESVQRQRLSLHEGRYDRGLEYFP